MRRIRNHDARRDACLGRMLWVEKTDEDFRAVVQQREYLSYFALFGNDNPVELEIGCGKGRFIRTIAKRRPDVNFLAVEVNGNVVIEACEAVLREGLPNVYFLRCGAELLEKYIPQGSIERIYLNFSCPFPKNRYENRRLTNPKYLAIYRHCLSPGGEVHQKTDDKQFFEYSVEQLSNFGARLRSITRDLHGDGCADNIMTEYEEKFTRLGLPIYRLEAVFNEPSK